MKTAFKSMALDRAQGRRRPDAGVTIIEAMIAMTVIAVGCFSALSTMVSSTTLDAELAERAIARRAAASRMETVLGYDYSDNIDNLVAHFTATGFASIPVSGLPGSAGSTTGTPAPAAVIAFNTTDHARIVVTVTVSWTSRRGPRTVSLSTVVTEVKH